MSSNCLPVVAYTELDQRVVADELKALPPGDLLRGWIMDYGVLRAQARVCR